MASKSLVFNANSLTRVRMPHTNMWTSCREIVTAVFSPENKVKTKWKHCCHFSQWLLKTYVSQVLSWRHWAKFCVSHGGFGAMAPAPLVLPPRLERR